MISDQGRIDAGGNGEVWAVTGDDGRDGAIKILRRRGGGGGEGAYRLGRFKDEISFLVEHPEFPGVLPLWDSFVSDDPRELSWYVMPVAVPVRKALGPDPAPRAVLAAVAEFAGTLTALVERGVAHRDIKPDNLFRLGDRWVVGDFGLVTYPEKDPRTEHGRRLGPIDYMAPEMREDADREDARPADVWALAKTLWVLLTGQSLPLPGTHRPGEPAHSLLERISFGFVAELDLLLERATQIDPSARISMAGMERELRACLADPPEARESAGNAELRARAAALTANARQQQAEFRERWGRMTKAWGFLVRTVREVGGTLSEALTFEVRMGQPDTGYHASMMLGHPEFTPHYGQSEGFFLIPPGQQRPTVEASIEAAMRVPRDDGLADIAALIRVCRNYVHQGTQDVHEVWARAYEGIPLGSAEEVGVLAEIRAELMNGIDEAMRLAIAILAESEGVGGQIQTGG
jgi:hypothetical protein